MLYWVLKIFMLPAKKIDALGGKVTREPGPVKGGTTHIAFITDPDGYQIELIQLD